jgi:hypothetical protein
MAVEWYYTTNQQQMGPVSWDELRELADVGILKPHDMVWSDGMDEWVKAINQNGLFAESDAAAASAPTKKAKFKAGKPPPGRRTFKRDEDEDDVEEDVRKERRANRKREEERYKMGVGVRIVLTLAGVGLLIFLLIGCVGGLLYISLKGDGGRPVAVAPAGPIGAAPVRDNFVFNNIGERKHLERTYRFTQGRRVVVTVTNNLANPFTDVDLLVFRGIEQNPARAFVADRRLPQVDRNCRVEFVVPATDNYRIRIANLGPGMANSCQVSVIEQ